MKIAVNTRLLLPNKLEGIGWFTYETFKRIVVQHPEHQFFFFFDRKFDPQFIFAPNVTPIILFPPTRHPLLWLIWFEYSVNKALKRISADIFISPDGYLSLCTKITQLAVIHDINFMHSSSHLPFLARKYYTYFFPKFAQKAEQIVTVSEFSKTDICNQFRVSPNKVSVAYNGANILFTPLSSDEKKQIKQKYTQNNEYFVFVGALNPRKNVARLLQAYDDFRKTKQLDIKMIIVGEKMFMTCDIEQAYEAMTFKNDVIFAGRLCPNELRLVMGGALALSFVPYFEGFGIPIVEAMYCDVPVITSNITSMPEVAGDAAILVDPFSVDAIRNAMIEMATNEPLRLCLIEKGKTRRQLFHWQNTADTLWQNILKVKTKKS